MIKKDVNSEAAASLVSEVAGHGTDFVSEVCEILGCTGANCSFGTVNFSRDERLNLFLDKFPEIFEGKQIVEFGSLESATSIEIFRKTNVSRLVAIEANSHAFARALTIRKHFPDYEIELLQGDCVEIFRQLVENKKLGQSTLYLTGILYHLHNPMEVFEIIRSLREKPPIAIWTHYAKFETKATVLYSKNLSGIKRHETGTLRYSFRNFTQDKDILSIPSYIGGNTGKSKWLTLESLIDGLEMAGYSRISIIGKQITDAGPTVQLVALEN